MSNSILPYIDENGVFSIRLESIGGLGANLAGKIIATVAENEMHLNVSSFSSYGSEKKGSPVKAFIRFADIDTVIRINNPIKNPDILVIFKDTLLRNSDVLAGCTQNTKIIINTSKSLEEIKQYINMPECHISIIDATALSLEHKVKVNGILLGALAKISGFISLDAMVNTFQKTVGKKYPHLMEGNIKALNLGYDLTSETIIKGDQNSFYPGYGKNIGIGYSQQAIGGVMTQVGNTLGKKHDGARYGVIPLFNDQKCIHCTMCHTVCPDQCITWERGKDSKTGKDTMNMIGIDYQYCKGCLKCVEICPVNALTEEEEKNYNVNELSKNVISKEVVF